MTKEKREHILELRKTGMGYQTIANQVGETKGAVAYICKSRGLAGLGEDIHPENTCEECGSVLILIIAGLDKK